MENSVTLTYYTPTQLSISKLTKAMGHPARIAILEIIGQQSCTCADLVEALPLAQSTVSQHIKELKNAGLIDGYDIPPKTIYSLNVKNYRNLNKLLESFIVMDI